MFTLSRNQFFLILFIAQTGTVFISVQARLIDTVQRNAWIIFILSSIVHYFVLLLYEKYYVRFQPGTIINWLYKGYWLYITVSFIAYIEYVIAVWAFPNTPDFIIIGIIVLISLYITLSRVETAINIGVILIPMITIFFFGLFIAWPEYKWTRLFPVELEASKGTLQGLLISQVTFIGVEIYLFLRKNVLQNEKIKGLPLFSYQMIWFTFFLGTFLFVLTFFSLSEIRMIPEPVMYILKSQQVGFIERLDLFFLFIWMTWSVVTVCIFSFMVMKGQQKKQPKNFLRNTLIYHLLLFILPLPFTNKILIDVLREPLVYVQVAFTFIIPISVFIMNRRKTT